MPLVDLDDPEELRARWSALAAVAHATGFDRRWYADEQGWYHQDETGSDLRMLRLDRERSVLFGFHTQHSQTGGADLLAGSPDWIGQPEVRRRMAAGQLGFVYGSFNGTWARAGYPGDPWQPADDGFAGIGTWLTSDEEAARELIEWAAEWADYLGGLDELLPVGVGLIRARELTPELLLDFFDRLGIAANSPRHPDLRAALLASESFRTIPGEASPAAVTHAPPTSSTPTPSAPATYAPGTSGPGASAPPVASAAPASSAPAPSAPAAPAPFTPALAAPAAPAPAAPSQAALGTPPVDEYLDDLEDEEESFIVPPGVSPFTGQPIDEGPHQIIGAPSEPDEPFTEEIPVASESPFAPEPPFPAEPPLRPDSPFAPEPPYTPEPEPLPEPEPDQPAQPSQDGYGVTARKQRRFGRKKKRDDENASLAGLGLVNPDPDDQPGYEGPAQPAYEAQGYAQTGYDEPGVDQRGYEQGQYEQEPVYGQQSLPSAEPPRVGGGVDEGEDFYASLFADAPAAATYTPDVETDQVWTEDPPEAPWSADDATSEFAAYTEDPTPDQPAAPTYAQDP
ncbi:MAG TPA: hypothetical protein VFG33_04030, partial [Kribbella sp.]|nr:hypothetical protein [Kribbella sp.]